MNQHGIYALYEDAEFLCCCIYDIENSYNNNNHFIFIPTSNHITYIAFFIFRQPNERAAKKKT